MGGTTGQASTASEPSAPLFRDVTAEWNVTFLSAQRFTGEYPIAEIIGHGVAAFDADGDQRLDLYFTNAGPRRADPAPDRLFLARADGGFRDATEGSGLGAPQWSTGVTAGDIDNDGDVDLYVGAWGPDRLYRNDGGGKFTDVTHVAGIVGDHLTTSSAFVDYDEDGFLDLFVAHYVVPNPDRVCGGTGGGREFCAPGAYAPAPDTLYRNRGDGTFEDRSVAAGIASQASSGLGVAVADLDDDGHVDIYVANDQRPNHLWRNVGDGTFEESALLLGAALSGRGNAEASMGLDIADVNGDGRLDIFVTHLAGESNTLYLAGAQGGFRDASVRSGVGAPSRPFTAFGTAFADVDLDGGIDLLVANGGVVRGERRESVAPSPFDQYAQPNQVLLNDGTGQFVDASASAAAFCEPVELSRGLALADLDRDGDQDVVLVSIGSPARVLANIAARKGRWLAVEAWDPALRRSVVGARIVIHVDGRTRVGLVGAGCSYMSQSSHDAHFGLGPGDGDVERIEVTWPGGVTESFAGGPADRRVRLERGSGTK